MSKIHIIPNSKDLKLFFFNFIVIIYTKNNKITRISLFTPLEGILRKETLDTDIPKYMVIKPLKSHTLNLLGDFFHSGAAFVLGQGSLFIKRDTETVRQYDTETERETAHRGTETQRHKNTKRQKNYITATVSRFIK